MFSIVIEFPDAHFKPDLLAQASTLEEAESQATAIKELLGIQPAHRAVPGTYDHPGYVCVGLDAPDSDDGVELAQALTMYGAFTVGADQARHLSLPSEIYLTVLPLAPLDEDVIAPLPHDPEFGRTLAAVEYLH